MMESIDRETILQCINGLIQYTLDCQAGLKVYYQNKRPFDPESRNMRTRNIIRGMTELYQLPEQTDACIDLLDNSLHTVKNGWAVEITPRAHQKDTVLGLLRYAKDESAQPSDTRERILLIRDCFEDMTSHLIWDALDNQVYPAIDWVDIALEKMTAQQNILFTRLLIGSERGPAVFGYVGGKVIDPASIAGTVLFNAISKEYPEIETWPTLCTVFRGGYGQENVRDITEVDLKIMNRCGDPFVRHEGVITCVYPVGVSITRDMRQSLESGLTKPERATEATGKQDHAVDQDQTMWNGQNINY